MGMLMSQICCHLELPFFAGEWEQKVMKEKTEILPFEAV